MSHGRGEQARISVLTAALALPAILPAALPNAPFAARAAEPPRGAPAAGYELGPELGSDTGEIRRHRAFAIIDRSIPVGFRRGEDLNVENTILLRRFIE